MNILVAPPTYKKLRSERFSMKTLFVCVPRQQDVLKMKYEASTHKSAMTQAGTVFVAHDLDL